MNQPVPTYWRPLWLSMRSAQMWRHGNSVGSVIAARSSLPKTISSESAAVPNEATDALTAGAEIAAGAAESINLRDGFFLRAA